MPSISKVAAGAVITGGLSSADNRGAQIATRPKTGFPAPSRTVPDRRKPADIEISTVAVVPALADTEPRQAARPGTSTPTGTVPGITPSTAKFPLASVRTPVGPERER